MASVTRDELEREAFHHFTRLTWWATGREQYPDDDNEDVLPDYFQGIEALLRLFPHHHDRITQLRNYLPFKDSDLPLLRRDLYELEQIARAEREYVPPAWDYPIVPDVGAPPSVHDVPIFRLQAEAHAHRSDLRRWALQRVGPQPERDDREEHLHAALLHLFPDQEERVAIVVLGSNTGYPPEWADVMRFRVAVYELEQLAAQRHGFAPVPWDAPITSPETWDVSGAPTVVTRLSLADYPVFRLQDEASEHFTALGLWALERGGAPAESALSLPEGSVRSVLLRLFPDQAERITIASGGPHLGHPPEWADVMRFRVAVYELEQLAAQRHGFTPAPWDASITSPETWNVSGAAGTPKCGGGEVGWLPGFGPTEAERATFEEWRARFLADVPPNVEQLPGAAEAVDWVRRFIASWDAGSASVGDLGAFRDEVKRLIDRVSAFDAADRAALSGGDVAGLPIVGPSAADRNRVQKLRASADTHNIAVQEGLKRAGELPEVREYSAFWTSYLERLARAEKEADDAWIATNLDNELDVLEASFRLLLVQWAALGPRIAVRKGGEQIGTLNDAVRAAKGGNLADAAISAAEEIRAQHAAGKGLDPNLPASAATAPPPFVPLPGVTQLAGDALFGGGPSRSLWDSIPTGAKVFGGVVALAALAIGGAAVAREARFITDRGRR
ncbi:hypothetical protein [Polyangium fumosum]|uniref:Uncharacterized protein n=1 Tax=Polyangium fumosum TaxID=889272 RepID=A0A4U1J083_9BACT|nr:hypothetical protein [Polyangium fumosum]TKD00415.1 hypothetical protein E8A74_34540 [Polyangium fumosum]